MLEHDLIGPDRSRADLAVGRLLHPLLTRDRLALRNDSHPARLAMARASLGIVLAQCPIARQDPQLQQVLPELELPALNTRIVTHEDLREVPRVRATFDHLCAAVDASAASGRRLVAAVFVRARHRHPRPAEANLLR